MTSALKLNDKGNTLEIELEGDFVLRSCDEIKIQLLKSLDRSGAETLVLKDATSFDVSAIQLVFAWKKSLEKQGRIATVVLPDNQDIKDLLSKTGITQIL
jgi:hypothetical protein